MTKMFFFSSQLYVFLLRIDYLYYQQVTNNNIISYDPIDKLIKSNLEDPWHSSFCFKLLT